MPSAQRTRGSAWPRSLRATQVTEWAASEHIALGWLVRLRWHAVGLQAVTIVVSAYVFRLAIPASVLLGIVGLLATSNLFFARWSRSGRAVTPAVIGGILAADTLVLTAELALAGGASNPLTALYLIEITLAALLLSGRWLAVLLATTAACYAFLLAGPAVRLELPDGGVARLGVLMVTAAVNGGLAFRVMRAFRERQVALARAQRMAARAERLASLTTLAAGAAHELSTPLGTIAVAATELEDLVSDHPAEALREARVIRKQVERCKQILQQMGAQAGQTAGEMPRSTSGGALFELVRRELGATAERLRTEGDERIVFEAPIDGLATVLANLVTNGLHASRRESWVTLSIGADDTRVRFTAKDEGTGIPGAILPRLGEPFFTTKPPGEGLGLGLFLAFTFAEACSGRLDIESSEGVGTRVQLELPRFMPSQS
jgi:two-component system sensor histidine kinase RegB